MSHQRNRSSVSSLNHHNPGQNGYTSGSVRLLQSNGQTYRESLDYKEPFQDEEMDTYSNNLPLYNGHTRQSFLQKYRTLVILGVCFLALLGLGWLAKPYASNVKISNWSSQPSAASSVSGFTGPRNAITFLNGTQFNKPPEMKFIGIIFFGRRQFVNILECYLRRNLKVNGGVLDEIHFLMHTDIEADKDWLKRLIKRDNMQEYYKLKAEDTGDGWSLWNGFTELYHSFMTDPNAIYVKIDDDLLFIDDYCIPEMLRVTLERPEVYSVQANIVNNKWNYWHHLRAGAIWPYLPDNDKSAQWPEDSWRASELPDWKGKLPGKEFEWNRGFDPPNEGHRWLPLPPTYKSLANTPYGPHLPNPMYHTKDTSAGWAVTAQSHYSFFQNHERRELVRYSYGNGQDHTWNQWYTRYNINMMAIRGTAILKKPFWGDEYPKIAKGDEHLMTAVIPKDLDMPVIVATRAIATHFSFKGDRPRMLRTDVLDRYRALANELYCAADNGKTRLRIEKLSSHQIPAKDRPAAGDADDSTDGEIGDGPQDLMNPDDDDDDDEVESGDDNVFDEFVGPASELKDVPAPKQDLGGYVKKTQDLSEEATLPELDGQGPARL